MCSVDLPTGILSLDIITNLSASIVITCWSHYLPLLLSNHSIIGWIPQDSLICWLLILCILILPTIFLNTFISIASNICLVFYVSALVSSAYVIIGCTVVYFLFCFFPHILANISLKITQSSKTHPPQSNLASFDITN